MFQDEEKQMILVDTSVWIDHFRKKNDNLDALLYRGIVQMHEFIIGELAIGNLKNRKPILDLLESVPKLKKLSHDEFMFFVDKYSLFGRGVGFVDIHLLAATKMANIKIWTLDKNLLKIAEEMNLNYL